MRDFAVKIAWVLLFGLTLSTARAAEKVAFEVNSPLIVAMGEAFRVEFSLNVEPERGSFKAPSFEGFDVIAGPSESTGHSIQCINGSITKKFSYAITYVLLPQAAGNFTLEAAEVTVDGTVYRTRPQLVEVVNEEESARKQAGSNYGGEDADVQNQIAKDDILIRTELSRSSVYKNEPLHVAVKLYTRVPISNIVPESNPSFNGFWSQNLSNPNVPPRVGRENYKGKVYDTQVLYDYLLYPQQVGTLAIEPVEMTVMAQVVVQTNHPADPFFGGGREVFNVPRKVRTQRSSVEVKSLPSGAPASFSGAVGRFAMDAQLPTERIAANSGATFTVKISGTGNLTFVQAPKLPLPTSFEQYNVKTTESINTSASGISGYRQFEYPFIARAEGTYDIPPIEFTYFDPQQAQYVTLRSKAMTLEITPDVQGGGDAVVMQGRGMSKEEVRMLGEDIRFIKLGNAQLRRERSPFMLGTAYWVSLLAIVGLFVASYLLLRKRIRESQNVALVRGKRASKVAVQRFRAAKRYLEGQNRHAFYEEMLRALWGYMSDKFNIPVANLTKENVREELHKRGVSAEDSQYFTDIITRCDEAQYSPVESVRMGDIYTEGVNLISRIESVIKR